MLHCRCAKCFSLPVRKRIRKRASAVTLLSLPEELLLYVLQCLSAEDLLAVRAVRSERHYLQPHKFSVNKKWFCDVECHVIPQVHSHLRDIIDGNSSVWARVSFKERWPAPDTVWLFERYDISAISSCL